MEIKMDLSGTKNGGPKMKEKMIDLPDRRHKNLGRPKGTTLEGVTRTLTREELKRFLHEAVGAGRKYDLAFSLIFHFALRVSEAVMLKLADFQKRDVGDGEPRLCITIHALKGGRTIDPPVPEEIKKKLRAWLKERRTLPEAERNPFLFPSRSHPRTDAATAESLKVAFRILAKRAGIPGRHSVHDLRHSRAQFAAFDGLPLVKIAGWLRHRDTSSADRYIHPVEMNRMASEMDESLERLMK
jgi:integrase